VRYVAEYIQQKTSAGLHWLSGIEPRVLRPGVVAAATMVVNARVEASLKCILSTERSLGISIPLSKVLLYNESTHGYDMTHTYIHSMGFKEII